MREGVSGIDGERREGGKDGPLEVFTEMVPLRVADLLRPEHRAAVRGETRLQLLQKIAMVLVNELAEARTQIVPSGTVRAAFAVRAGVRRELYAIDGEELIDVGAEDGEELHALAQRHPGIAHLREHATVGLEP